MAPVASLPGAGGYPTDEQATNTNTRLRPQHDKIHKLQREIGKLKKTRNKHKLNCNFLRKVRSWCKKKISNRICCWNDVHKGYGLEFLEDTV